MMRRNFFQWLLEWLGIIPIVKANFPNYRVVALGQPVINSPETLRCSFCGKSQDKVLKLIAGPSCFICNECIAVCNKIIAEDAAEKSLDPNSIADRHMNVE